MQNWERCPRPVKIASVKNLRKVWYQSRDAKGTGGSPGIDGVYPRRFGVDLERNLAGLRDELCGGYFAFQKLRPVLIPKENGSDRVICVPTVRDRLVQRLIASYLNAGDKLRIENSVSFGFRPKLGVRKAVRRARDLRSEYPWVLKSDIASFFDSIDRNKLRAGLLTKLGRCSVLPFLYAAIDCEVDRSDWRTAKRINAAGITDGRGLRQGMPLSPLLSNFVLREFDRWFEARGAHLVRYADDFVIFSNNKSQCEELLLNAQDRLCQKNHTLQHSKTFIYEPSQPVEFLGFEIARSKLGRRYRILVPKRAFDAIEKNLKEEFENFDKVCKEYRCLSHVVSTINATVNGFVNVYIYAKNFSDLASHAHNCRRHVLEKLLAAIFGRDILARLDPIRLRFLEVSELSLTHFEKH